MTAPDLHLLAPIGLADLTEQAGLLTRTERKYLLPADAVRPLLAGLPTGTRVLEIDGERSFGYASTYFDTWGLACYHATARRRRHRFKLRTRRYVGQDLCFLEAKVRGPRGVTIKHRVPWPYGDYLARGPEVASLFTAAGVAHDPGDFGPAVISRYRRSTLWVASAGTRMTIDTDLVWSLPDGTALPLAGRAVVETKSAPGRTSVVDRLLWSLGHRPCTVSKFGTGLAALRPELPAHRWRLVLRRHLEID